MAKRRVGKRQLCYYINLHLQNEVPDNSASSTLHQQTTTTVHTSHKSHSSSDFSYVTFGNVETSANGHSPTQTTPATSSNATNGKSASADCVPMDAYKDGVSQDFPGKMDSILKKMSSELNHPNWYEKVHNALRVFKTLSHERMKTALERQAVGQYSITQLLNAILWFFRIETYCDGGETFAQRVLGQKDLISEGWSIRTRTRTHILALFPE